MNPMENGKQSMRSNRDTFKWNDYKTECLSVERACDVETFTNCTNKDLSALNKLHLPI